MLISCYTDQSIIHSQTLKGNEMTNILSTMRIFVHTNLIANTTSVWLYIWFQLKLVYGTNVNKKIVAVITINPFLAFKLIASLLPNPIPIRPGLGGTENAGEATNSVEREDQWKD